ncbi:MAG: arsenic efflux protein [Lachnospiraceae bacterium]|nr:arsenic efflux protein [Lachnospiraceae bacterium]
MWDIILDSLLDTAKLIPFLLLTYIVMEYLEHRAGAATVRLVRRGGKWGPVIGAAVGVVPQCGFSAAAASLYAGRVITLGTLIAIFLSTSDEMLPILISAKASPILIAQILGIKVVMGMAAGFCIDLFGRGKQQEQEHIHELCEHDHCHCGEEGILKSALLHTLQIAGFILVINFVLNLLLEQVGADTMSQWIWNRPVIGELLSGAVGLIPNCASSVAITQLYLEGAMDFGAMMSGLMANTGVGLLVLCRSNRHGRENLKIIGLLYGISVLGGLIAGLLPIA